MITIKTIVMFLFLAGMIIFTGMGQSLHNYPEQETAQDKCCYPVEKGDEIGIVSYYGEKWNGRTTANMEIYDCNLLTCASPTLPFNTIIEITNIATKESVIVRVNDRGPYKMDRYGKAIFPLVPHPVRVLDLSRAAFDSIGDLKQGLLRVKLKIVKQ